MYGRHTRSIYSITGQMESICNDGRVYFSEVLCYGIGHVGMCQSALHQVALLLAMVEEWKPPHTWIFDPVLQPEETRALEAIGLEVIPKNEVSGSVTM